MDFIQEYRKFIAIDSTPQQGSREIMEAAADLCSRLNLTVQMQAETINGEEQFNILVRPGQRPNSQEFLFQTHLDTVDPGPYQMWKHNEQNPFHASIDDGHIYGLGAADVKLDFICKARALAKYANRQSWRLPPVLVGTFGEETGMHGALRLIRKNKVHATMALIGEPSDLQLIRAGMGMARVEIRIPFSAMELKFRDEHNLRESTSTQSKVFYGKAAHSSTPHLGESAIRKMFDYLLMLPERMALMEVDGGTNDNSVPIHAFLEIEMAAIEDSVIKKLVDIYKTLCLLEESFLSHKDSSFSPAYPTMNIGLMRTYNDHVFMSGTFRMHPLITQQTYENWMYQIREACQQNGAQFQVTDYKKAFCISPQSMLLKSCIDELRGLGLSGDPITQSSCNEASIFSRVGIECLGFGPGRREGNIHTPEERVALADLETATLFYERILERLCI